MKSLGQTAAKDEEEDTTLTRSHVMRMTMKMDMLRVWGACWVGGWDGSGGATTLPFCIFWEPKLNFTSLSFWKPIPPFAKKSSPSNESSTRTEANHLFPCTVVSIISTNTTISSLSSTDNC